MFPIIHVQSDAADLTEALGTKPKFWFHDGDGRPTLYKEGRPNSGEHWAEKICCELCRLLEIPHATYELAEWRGRNGVVSASFVPEGARLVLGNELLAKLMPDYPQTVRYRVRQHTVRLVMAIMSSSAIHHPVGYVAPEHVKSAADIFVGYLLLDALVGNQDRHHENWGLILIKNQEVVLAPTFDHASSLGRNERDDERIRRLATRDKGSSIEHYASRAKSAFYATPTGPTTLSTVEAFSEAARISPVAAQYWLNQLRQLSVNDLDELIQEVPDAEMSLPARRFAAKMIEINRGRLLSQQVGGV